MKQLSTLNRPMEQLRVCKESQDEVLKRKHYTVWVQYLRYIVTVRMVFRMLSHRFLYRR